MNPIDLSNAKISETPETDSACFPCEYGDPKELVVPIAIAEKLELELNKAKELLKKYL